MALDIKEGADMVMVKPGLPYLDIIKLVKENFKIPIMAYQVSGEYSLLTNGIKKGFIDRSIILESLIAFIDLHDSIYIKKINKKSHSVKFYGKFSNRITINNSIFKLIKSKLCYLPNEN